MTTKQIKFSHKYAKMPDGYETSKLMQIFIVDYSELAECFVKYDTEYWENKSNGYYQLPEGKLIVLLLKSWQDCLWTTIRSWNAEKERYYRDSIGETFEIVIKSVGKAGDKRTSLGDHDTMRVSRPDGYGKSGSNEASSPTRLPLASAPKSDKKEK